MPAFAVALGAMVFVVNNYPVTAAVTIGAILGWLAWRSYRAKKLARLQRTLVLDDVAAFRWRDDIDPIEFEARCAQAMRFAGWKTAMTKGSGDQGVDVIAQRDGVKVALQCKRYSKPVGNRAVQEVFAAKTFIGAEFAAVVSNSTYTPSAKQLAKSTGVLLLHFTDLARPSRHFGLADKPSHHQPSQVTLAKLEQLRRRRYGIPYAVLASLTLAYAITADNGKVTAPSSKATKGAVAVAKALAPSSASASTRTTDARMPTHVPTQLQKRPVASALCGAERHRARQARPCTVRSTL